MNRNILSLICIILTALSITFASERAFAEFQKTKIAVLDFELIGDKLETADMGAILSEWFITSIVKSGRFDVVERAMLQKILSEQKLSATGIIDETSASQLGKILGVKVIISGSVLRIRDTVEINSRVIDVESGSIIAAENIRGNASTDLYGLVVELTAKIMRNFPLTGYVVKRNKDSVIIDLGLVSGLSPGTEFIVYQEGEVIKHPKTGEVLDVEQIIVGRLEITKVSQNVAEGKILSEEPPGIQYGHMVKSVQMLASNDEQVGGRYGAPLAAETAHIPEPPPVPEPTVRQEPPQQVIPIRPDKKKIVASPQTSGAMVHGQTGQQTLQTSAAASAPPTGDYRIALLPWIMYREAGSMTTVLTSRLVSRIADTPGVKLTKSYYQLKGVSSLKFNGSESSLWNGATPNVARIKELGMQEGFDAALLGKLNVVCHWADSCDVPSFNISVVNLRSGKVYTETGSDWNQPARDYIEQQTRRVFQKFSRDIQ